MADQGISGFGTTLTGSVSGLIAQITSLGFSGFDVDDLDVTTMDSTNGWREFIAGLKDAGELTLDLIYEEDNCDVVLTALGGSGETWTIALPDGSTLVVYGYMRTMGIEVPMDDRMTQSAAIKLSGEPVFVGISAS